MADHGLEASREKSCEFQWPLARKAQALCQGCGKDLSGKASGLIWTRWIVCVCAQLFTHWNARGKYGPHGELFLFLGKKEQVAASNEVLPNPCVSAETLKACVMIGLHLLAAEGDARESGCQSPDSGDMWRQGCPKSPEWISSCSASETSLGCEVYEPNNECRAIHVIGQDWSSEVVALFPEIWELGRAT